MLDICYEELDLLKEHMENNEFKGVQYLDTWDFEDNYSHNRIERNREEFVELANKFFKENNLPYTMREVCENAMVCDIDGNVLKLTI